MDVRRDGYRANGLVLHGEQIAFRCEDSLVEKAMFPDHAEVQTDGFLCFARTGKVVGIPDSLEIRNAEDRTLGICDTNGRCFHVFRSSVDSLTYAPAPDPTVDRTWKQRLQEVISENRNAIIGLGVASATAIGAFLLLRNGYIHLWKMPDP